MSKKGKCDLCGYDEVVVHFSYKSKVWRCRRCADRLRYHSFPKMEYCKYCRLLKRIAVRENYEPVCTNCYRNILKDDERCYECGLMKKVVSFHGTKMCSTCISRKRMKDLSRFETCKMCSSLKPVCTRDGKGNPICYSCYYLFKGKQ